LERLQLTLAMARRIDIAMFECTLPPRGQPDALHVAIAATSGIQYLLTWNCRHLADAILRPRIEAVCRSQGVEPPIICTPLELLEAVP